MRRLIAAALLTLFVLQSSGAASAAPAAPPFFAEVSLDVGNAYDAFVNTRIGALMTGHSSHYAAVHAPPLPRPSVDRIMTPAQARHVPSVRPIFRQGVRGTPPQLGRHFVFRRARSCCRYAVRRFSRALT